MQVDPIQRFIAAAIQSVFDYTLSKITLGNYVGDEKDLRNIYVRKVTIKQEPKLSFTYRYKSRDIVKNIDPSLLEGLLENLLSNDFKVANLFTTSAETQFERLPNGKTIIREKETSNASPTSYAHDHNKKRLIHPAGKSYLQALKITDTSGEVYQNSQDKYKQINHYIDLLNPLITSISAENIHRVVDMGSGKGYLTFALYDYLHNVLSATTEVVGVEYRADLVALCNNIASESGFDKLHFEEGTIFDYSATKVDLLIALHACDTATDDAIFRGISSNAKLIVVAPCCHKQIRKEMEKGKSDNGFSSILRHGVFMERQAEMVTDALRALYLEYAGYSVKVMQFISDAHTPKNVMITGTRQKEPTERQKMVIAEKIKAIKMQFGIEYHHLGRLMEL